MSALLQDLQWRYATKKFDATKKLSQEQLDELLEAGRLSASSFGLQAYKLYVITDAAVRESIKNHAWGQTQITDASHLIAIVTHKSIDEAYVDEYTAHVAKERGVPAEALKNYRDMMAGSVSARSADPVAMAAWLKAQGYIALGFLLSQAAHMHIDACPMEGFDPITVGQDLGLPANLQVAVLCPVGFRAQEDETAAYKKVRSPKEEFFVWKK